MAALAITYHNDLIAENYRLTSMADAYGMPYYIGRDGAPNCRLCDMVVGCCNHTVTPTCRCCGDQLSPQSFDEYGNYCRICYGEEYDGE